MAQFFNDNLKYIRKQKGISQQQLADKIGVDRSSISRWESGDMGITVDSAYLISLALDVSLPDLVGKDLKTGTSYEKTNEDYKKILIEKGLMDTDGNIDKENFEKLIKIADMVNEMTNKKKQD